VVSGYTVTMLCWNCNQWVSPVPDNCTNCGEPLIPVPENAVEKPCEDCGKLVMWPADDDWVICPACIKVLMSEVGA
jgi:predicted RNA-binding Zn-ribbon protein involved in translation (DUF1610 family)